MLCEWDEDKRTAKLAKHKLDFAEAVRLNWQTALTIQSVHAGEVRHITLAEMNDRLYTLVWTWRAEVMRLISFRRANNREIDLYEKADPQQ